MTAGAPATTRSLATAGARRAAAPPAAAVAGTWLALTRGAISISEVSSWAVRPDCGALALFAGTVRDHSEGRPGVTALDYEAYEEPALERLGAIADEARRLWPGIGRVAMLHRLGELGLSEVSVVVAVSSPHRHEAFEAARFCIESVKATVPVWKRETWSGGRDWGTGARKIAGPAPAAAPAGGRPAGGVPAGGVLAGEELADGAATGTVTGEG
ncbi:MAG: molybdenum cofactor biosynthesis protein MoaE [Acidimicrobiales bacterium]